MSEANNRGLIVHPPTCPTGPTQFTGTTEPWSIHLGSVGDTYLNSTTCELYVREQDGWELIGSIDGPAQDDPRWHMQVTEPNWGETRHGATRYSAKMGLFRTWWWHKRTAQRIAALPAGACVRITDDDLCWKGRTGDFIRWLGTPGNYSDMVEVKLHGGVMGEIDYSVQVSVWGIERIVGQQATQQETWWVQHIMDLNRQARVESEQQARMAQEWGRTDEEQLTREYVTERVARGEPVTIVGTSLWKKTPRRLDI
jgi:hypothetical protein